MSERYKSRTGEITGNAIDYLESQMREEWDKEKKYSNTMSDYSRKYIREEEIFYQNPQMTPALQAAINAVVNPIKKERKKMKFNAIQQEDPDKKTIWIKDGDSVFGVFRGDIHEYKIHWVDKNKLECKGDDCQHCGSGSKARFQFRINFVHKIPDAGFISAFYENDWHTYKRLNKLNEASPLEEIIVRLYKGVENGFKVDMFEKVKALTPEQTAAVDAVKLLDVNPAQSNQYANQDINNEDIPF